MMQSVAPTFGDLLWIEFKVLDERLREWGLPSAQSDMAAAIDLYACVDGPMTLLPQAPARLIPAGFSMFIGNPYVTALILPRSGTGHRKGLVLGNTVGVVDPDFLGHVMISAWNRSGVETDPIVIAPGERIAQMLFVPIIRPLFKRVEEFSRQTPRGEGGFGSTGS
jgi:dUTP pyrophosphatase